MAIAFKTKFWVNNDGRISQSNQPYRSSRRRHLIISVYGTGRAQMYLADRFEGKMLAKTLGVLEKFKDAEASRHFGEMRRGELVLSHRPDVSGNAPHRAPAAGFLRSLAHELGFSKIVFRAKSGKERVVFEKPRGQ